MGSSPPISAPVVLLFLLALPSWAAAVNVTTLLAAYPELTAFNRLMTATSVAAEVAGRSSVTLLAVPNAIFLRSAAERPDMADVLRYHVLLQYLSWPDLRAIPPAGKLVTTLFQTTGRASANLGALNLTRSPFSGRVSARSPSLISSSNATILSLVKSLPYNVSIFTVDSLLIPYGLDLAASESGSAPGLNITRVLADGKDFNVVATMLAASGAVGELEADERGPGITVFAPTDEAFGSLPATERLQSLPADRKAAVLRFHVLHSYYPLGSLDSIVNPVQPTLATEDTTAGRFTLNITRVNGSVAIDTGLVQASITRTVFDHNPVAVFAVSRVLLPREIFGRFSAAGENTSPPDGGLAPEYPPPTRPTAPPSLSGEIASKAAVAPPKSFCIAWDLLYLLLVFLLLIFKWDSRDLALISSVC